MGLFDVLCQKCLLYQVGFCSCLSLVWRHAINKSWPTNITDTKWRQNVGWFHCHMFDNSVMTLFGWILLFTIFRLCHNCYHVHGLDRITDGFVIKMNKSIHITIKQQFVYICVTSFFLFSYLRKLSNAPFVCLCIRLAKTVVV